MKNQFLMKQCLSLLLIIFIFQKGFAACPGPQKCEYGSGYITWQCLSSSSSSHQIDTLPYPQTGSLHFYNDPGCNQLAAQLQIIEVPFSHSNMEVDGALGAPLTEFNKSVIFHYDFQCVAHDPCEPPPKEEQIKK